MRLRAPLVLRWASKDAATTIGMPLVKDESVVAFQGEGWDVACFDRSGRTRWRVQGDAESAAIVGDEVVARVKRGDRRALVFIDLSTGTVRREEVISGGSLAAVVSLDQGFIQWDYPEPRVARRALTSGLPLVWERAFGGAGQAKVDLRLACDGERCLVAVTPGRGPTTVFALDFGTGREVWSVPVTDLDEPAEEGLWDPALTQGLVVINTRNGVAALKTDSGQRVWQTPTVGARTVSGDRVFVRGMNLSAEGQPSDIVVLDLRTGREIWRRLYPEVLKKSRANRLIGYLGVTETHIFSGDGAGGLWAFDSRDGSPVWYHRAKGSDGFSPWLSPVIAGGRLYVTTMGDRQQLLCYEETQAGAAKEAAETEPAEATLRFAIDSAHTRQKVIRAKPYFERGGPWTVLQCRSEDGAGFVLAVDGEAGAGRLWVEDAKGGEGLLKAVRKAFPAKGAAAAVGKRVSAPVSLDVAILGSGVGESGQGKGTWTMSKWTGEEDVPEFFVNWSVAEKRGAIAEKDETYRKDLIRLVARLLAR